MLSSNTRDLARAPDGYDAFLFVERFLELLCILLILQVPVDLNVHTKTHTWVNLAPMFVKIVIITFGLLLCQSVNLSLFLSYLVTDHTSVIN